jgi:hypothetical protein
MSASSQDPARLGLTVTFRPGEGPGLVVDDLRRLGVRRLRAVFSALEWSARATEAADLLEALARAHDVLPCVVTTPAPPGAGALADFVEALLARCDPDVAWVELRVEAATPELLDAARLVRALGRRLVLSLAARDFVDHARDVPLELACVVGVELDHEASATWAEAVDRARAALPGCPAWVVRAGCSTFPRADLEQARALLAALRLPVERCYWDGPRDGPALEGGGDLEQRARARGLLDADGREKLAARLLVGGGVEGLREVVAWADRSRSA